MKDVSGPENNKNKDQSRSWDHKSCWMESDQPGCAGLGLLEGEEGWVNLRRARRPHCCSQQNLAAAWTVHQRERKCESD